MKKGYIITAAALVVLLLLLLAILFWPSKKDGGGIVIWEKKDTVYVRNTDTVTIKKIYMEPSRIDTFFVFNELHDTLYVSGIAIDTINIDSLVLGLVSNYPVVIDSIFMDRIIANEENVSLFAGVDGGICINGKPDIGARVGIGIGRHSVEAGYDFISKRVVIGYRYKIIRKMKRKGQ